ncbi:Maltose/maltodextrin import ATP-binding protein MalK [Planctomycetes bacterium MalM25]|nr:Maltose/maltodextrin import ATP-binding protein MalK [Planctomycetes bacterium MalM25]
MIQVDGLTLRAGQFRLQEASLRVSAGEYAVLMGRSGSGKTTLLETLAGLRSAEAGQVVLGGVDVTEFPPAERGVGYVPQDVALFTTMSVAENLGYGLRVRAIARSAVRQRVTEVSRLLGIERLLDRDPAGLSGGEARRVALGRAIGFRPKVLLLDEPLGGLDEATRDDVYGALEAVRSATGASVLHVSHDQRDADRLADRLFEIAGGSLDEAPFKRTDAAGRSAASEPARAPTPLSS